MNIKINRKMTIQPRKNKKDTEREAQGNYYENSKDNKCILLRGQ